MNLLLWGLTVGTVGKLILGLAVLRVHLGILHEHKIDGIVLKSIRRERYVTLFALLLIVIGYVLEILFYNGSTLFFDCVGAECSALINAAFSQ